LKRKSHRRVYQILKKWGVQQYEVIDKKALQEITLGAFILATGGGADPDDKEWGVCQGHLTRIKELLIINNIGLHL